MQSCCCPVHAPAERTRLLANGALLLANIIFGVGNVIGQMGINNINPVFFALIREVIAGPLLCVLAHFLEGGARPRRADLWRFGIAGVGLFLCNFFFILGVKLAGSTAAGVWQPAQPVFLTALACSLGFERATAQKVGGIAVAVAGCLMVSFGDVIIPGSAPATPAPTPAPAPAPSAPTPAPAGQTGSQPLLGNLMFFLQALGCSCFYIACKPLLRSYGPIATVGWSYIVASSLMTVTVVAINESPPALHFVCASCGGDGWRVDATASLAIAYWVVLGSVGGYLLNTWGNKHVDASLLGTYTVVQPIATIAFSQLAIATSAPPHWGLKALAYNDAWAVLIFAGLLMVVRDNKRNNRGAGGEDRGAGGGDAAPLLDAEAGNRKAAAAAAAGCAQVVVAGDESRQGR